MGQRKRIIEVTLAYLCCTSAHTVKTYRFSTSTFWGRTHCGGKPSRSSAGDYSVAVKSRSVYDSQHPLWLTRLLPGSGGACILKTNVQMHKSPSSDCTRSPASSASISFSSSLRFVLSTLRYVTGVGVSRFLDSLAAHTWLNLFAQSRRA